MRSEVQSKNHTGIGKWVSVSNKKFYKKQRNWYMNVVRYDMGECNMHLEVFGNSKSDSNI